ncbi:hypothetical protein SNEBB_002087 [Seison nebaliae]|nr:hypothetical protein SNEBB_002087 [Seison nebaliae]
MSSNFYSSKFPADPAAKKYTQSARVNYDDVKAIREQYKKDYLKYEKTIKRYLDVDSKKFLDTVANNLRRKKIAEERIEKLLTSKRNKELLQQYLWVDKPKSFFIAGQSKR